MMVVGIVIGAIVLLLVLIFVFSYNGLVKSNIAVEEAFSTMDVYLKKRFDLIPNLVETVKGYVKHEDETLTKLTQLRQVNYGLLSSDKKVELGSDISRVMPKFLALSENYPELKANQNFIDLSNQLSKVEDDIANSRKYYNGTVKNYNTKVMSIPTNIIAGLCHFDKKAMYEIDEESQRENVKVEF